MAAMDGGEAAALLEDLRARVAAMPGARLTLTWRLTRRRAGGTA
jgi:hypothetical protein